MFQCVGPKSWFYSVVYVFFFMVRRTLIVHDLLRFIYDDIFNIGRLVNLSRSEQFHFTSSSCNTVYACKHDNVNSYDFFYRCTITHNNTWREVKELVRNPRNTGLYGRCSVSVLWSSPAMASRRRVTGLIAHNYPRLRCLRLLVGPVKK